MDRPPRPLTPQQVADLLSVSADTVNRWADEGKLSGFRTPSGRWRFHHDAIAAFLPPEPQPEASS